MAGNESSSLKVAAPTLRPDLKISRQVMSERVSFVIKDPIKNEYFRFSEDEWGIISLFDGKRHLEEIIHDYNQAHENPLDLDTLKDYQKNLDSMNLLFKSKKEMNILLVEKMKEMRASQLLSKKGSLTYKRFPLVDPDRFFNKIIPYIGFFWTKKFLFLSVSCMLMFALIVVTRWTEFQDGVFAVFEFSQFSFWNLLFLWITIYFIIALHELGHGLTCKFYGGEVHEIGFLLLFFQPCLYCNVNDAWLFDRKWKQVMVTIAGGYIEFWVGSLFSMVWAVTNPNTMIHMLSFQVMVICSLSTIFCNFNPLMKLDGYYLLADFVEIPNLRDGSFNYLKYLSSRYVFQLKNEEFEATPHERRVYFIYGILCACWVAMTMLGLFFLAKNFLVERFHEIGVLISLWVAYKLFGGYVMKIKAFAVQWATAKAAILRSSRGKKLGLAGVVLLVGLLFVPVSYSVSGSCHLEASQTEVIRTPNSGVLTKFILADGATVQNGDNIALIQNESLGFDVEISRLGVEKLQIKQRNFLKENAPASAGIQREIAAKNAEFDKKSEYFQQLSIKLQTDKKGLAILSCDHQVKKINTFVKAGDEICRAHFIQELRALVEIPEHQVGFLNLGNGVDFHLGAEPLKSYEGRISHVRSLSKRDPLNPKAKIYLAEILVSNPGELRPGMSGTAKVTADRVFAIQYMGRKLSNFFRMDLFL